MAIIYCSICGRSLNGKFEILNHYKTVHYQQYVDVADTTAIKSAKKKIKGAIVAGIISGVITTILALAGTGEFGKWNLLDSALIFGLVLGIYKNSRACAVILFVYWIISKLIQVYTIEINLIWLIVSIIISVYFWKGIMGTFEYRRCLGETIRQLSQLANLNITISDNNSVGGEIDNKNQLQ
jgi:hypothetical protein